jgi:hypothetical protein
MRIEPIYTSENRKFYRIDDEQRLNVAPRIVPSASMVIGALTNETFDRVPFETLLRAELEGIGAHTVSSNVALLLSGTADSVTIPRPPSEYPGTPDEWTTAMDETLVDAETFFRDKEVEPIAIEQPALSRYGFAGTPDLKCWIKWRRRRVMAVIDYKRVAQISSGHYLKLQSYRMLDGFDDCRLSLILWFKKGGGHQALEVKNEPSDHAAIASQAGVYRWQLSRGILKAA